jgi:predicted deacylase
MKTYLILMLLSFSAFATDFPDGQMLYEIDSDSQIRGPSYREIVRELDSLAAKYPKLASVYRYGKSVKGEDLTLIKISKPNTSGPAVYIGGSIHGNEYLNIEDRLPAFFLMNTSKISAFLDKGGAIYIAPILNPDGYDRRERENVNNVDLNRDFTVRRAGVVGFKQPETASLSKFLQEELARDKRTLKLTMDYHCCIGAILHAWSFKGPVLSQSDQLAHSKIATLMKKNLGSEFRIGTTPTVLGYNAKGTSKDHYFEQYGSISFTFEGRRGKENKYFDQHAKMWLEILEGL